VRFNSALPTFLLDPARCMLSRLWSRPFVQRYSFLGIMYYVGYYQITITLFWRVREKSASIEKILKRKKEVTRPSFQPSFHLAHDTMDRSDVSIFAIMQMDIVTKVNIPSSSQNLVARSRREEDRRTFSRNGRDLNHPFTVDQGRSDYWSRSLMIASQPSRARITVAVQSPRGWAKWRGWEMPTTHEGYSLMSCLLLLPVLRLMQRCLVLSPCEKEKVVDPKLRDPSSRVCARGCSRDTRMQGRALANRVL
jgi:hypothetical protein